MKVDPNSPLMPYKELEYSGHPSLGDILVHKSGISIRAHFAGLAMQGYASADYIANSGMPVEQIAEWSVQMADALIAELNKEKP